MYENHLQQAGLSTEQAIIYEILAKNGIMKAGKLTKLSEIKRGMVYKTLDQLIEMGLVDKLEDPGEVAQFRAKHPLKLKELAKDREQKAKDAQLALEGVLPSIVSDFNLATGRPGIQFFEGKEGIKQIYDDILKTGETIYLVRAIYEPVFEKEIVPVIKDFIKKRVVKGIKVKAITPKDIVQDGNQHKKDAQILFERTWVDKNYYNSPVEINVYGNKLAILSFDNELIGMIIESPQIARAYRQIFMLADAGARVAKRPPTQPENRPPQSSSVIA